jgi:uncharacterized membrane protein
LILTIFSLIYGPLVVWLLEAFTPTQSSLAVMGASVVLIALNIRVRTNVWIIPAIYFAISLVTLVFGKSALLYFAPILISIGVAGILSSSKTPAMIQEFLNRWRFLRDKNFSQEQIRSNTWVWSVAAWINVCVHAGVLTFATKWWWAFYVSVGWYAVFALAALVHLGIWQKRRGKNR